MFANLKENIIPIQSFWYVEVKKVTVKFTMNANYMKDVMFSNMIIMELFLTKAFVFFAL